MAGPHRRDARGAPGCRNVELCRRKVDPASTGCSRCSGKRGTPWWPWTRRSLCTTRAGGGSTGRSPASASCKKKDGAARPGGAPLRVRLGRAAPGVDVHKRRLLHIRRLEGGAAKLGRAAVLADSCLAYFSHMLGGSPRMTGGSIRAGTSAQCVPPPATPPSMSLSSARAGQREGSSASANTSQRSRACAWLIRVHVDGQAQLVPCGPHPRRPAA